MCKACETFFGDQGCPISQERGAWSHYGVVLRDNPGKKFRRHNKSKSHVHAKEMKTQVRIEKTLNMADKETRKEKENTNELYISKLIKIVHFLGRNNLPVKELYPKLIKFLAEEIEEPIIKQYLESAPMNATYDSSDSCDGFLLSLNQFLQNLSDKELQLAVDIVVFADEATSVARKEMIGLFASYVHEETKSFKLEFVKLTSVPSTKSEILIEKMKEILSERNVDIVKTRFVCFDGTNATSGEKNEVQRRYHNCAPYSIYVNCCCHRLALCFKHLMVQFPWLQTIDTLLLGLWKTFHYSSLNRHIFTTLQEAYGSKALQLVKAAVTCWLSHGAACRRCRERYVELVESLDQILTQNKNVEWLGYRSTLLEAKTVLEITFLEDVLSITNALCLLLQSDRKDFGAISRAVESTLTTLNNIKSDPNSPNLKSFKQSRDIMQRISTLDMRETVAGNTRKKSRIDTDISMEDFHTSVIQPFVKALSDEIASAFDLSDLPILNAFLKIDPSCIPTQSDISFTEFGTSELKVLFEFYGKDAVDKFQGKITRAEKIITCPLSSLELELGGYKNYVATLKEKKKDDHRKILESLEIQMKQMSANKYTTKKAIRSIETKQRNTKERIEHPVTVEDLLDDGVISQAFPNIQRLLCIYLLIPHTEAVVERGFSKMSQIMTKKRSTLDDKSLDMLMRISYRKEPLKTNELKEIIDIWKGLRDRRIFSNDV